MSRRAHITATALALVLSVLMACHQAVKTPPVPAQTKQAPLKFKDYKTTATQGQAVATLTGGGLGADVVVPLWLSYSEDENLDDKCGIHLVTHALQLHTGDIYVAQDNIHCGGGPICKVIQAGQNTFTSLKHCIQGEELALTGYEHLRDDYYWITSAAEGYAIAQIIRYDIKRGQTTLLDIPMGMIHTAAISTRRDGSFLIETKCPMPAGCTTTSPEALPLKRYVWHPDSPKVFSTEPVPSKR